MNPSSPMRASDWVDRLQAAGGLTFLRQQVIDECGISKNAAQKALARLAARKRVVKIKDYFYSIVPGEHLQAGAPPAHWVIPHLMEAMGVPYYIGNLSAAAQHGSSPQAVQEYQVIVDRGLRPMRIGKTRIRFFSKKNLSLTPTLELNTPAGRMRLSTPEATALDLVHFAKRAGGLDHAGTVIAGLVDRMDPKKLLAAAKAMDAPHDVQRLGFILDRLKQRKFSNSLAEWLDAKKPAIIPLFPGSREKDAKLDRRWNLLVGTPLEIEA